MIPVDLSVNCESGIYDPNGSGIQLLGIRSRDPFSGSTDMSGSKNTSGGSLNSLRVQIDPDSSGVSGIRSGLCSTQESTTT